MEFFHQNNDTKSQTTSQLSCGFWGSSTQCNMGEIHLWKCIDTKLLILSYNKIYFNNKAFWLLGRFFGQFLEWFFEQFFELFLEHFFNLKKLCFACHISTIYLLKTKIHIYRSRLQKVFSLHTWVHSLGFFSHPSHPLVFVFVWLHNAYWPIYRLVASLLVGVGF